MSTFSMFRRPATIALSLTASIAIVACNPTPAPSPVTSVAVPTTNPASPLIVGTTAQAAAKVTATTGTAITVTWTSSKPAVASINVTTGVISAITPGTTDITATSTADTSKKNTVTITVKAATTPVVTGVALTLTPATAPVGGAAKATVAVAGTNQSQNVTYTSSKPEIATVDKDGNIKAVAAGSTEIKATSGDDNTKSDTKTFTVTAAGGGTTLTTAKINFQTAATVTLPAGYAANTGAKYDVATGIGWVTEASVGPTPVVGDAQDMTANARNRGVSNGVTDPRQYTQINMQCNNQLVGDPCSSGELKSGAFQYKVVNGTYDVTVGVGEASNDVNSIMQINFESKTPNFVNAVNKFVSGPAARNLIVTKTVTVADGMLTVDAIGGNNTKINFLEIAPTPVK